MEQIENAMFDKIKSWFHEHKREVVLFLFIFLVSTISFGVGYLMGLDQSRAPIVIEKIAE
ncbi:MAG: hypothetical protein AAB518_00515 [Patescibacteria group bacterium]